MPLCEDTLYSLIEAFGEGDMDAAFVLKAEIDLIYRDTGLADISYTVVLPEEQTLPTEDVEFFYHCQYDTGYEMNGHFAFFENEEVYVLHLPDRGDGTRTYIIGHVDIRATNICNSEYILIWHGYPTFEQSMFSVFDVGAGTLLDLDNFVEATGSPPAKPDEFPNDTFQTWFKYYFESSSSSISVPYTTEGGARYDGNTNSYSGEQDSLPEVGTPPPYPNTYFDYEFEDLHWDGDTVRTDWDDGDIELSSWRYITNISSGEGLATFQASSTDIILPYHAVGTRTMIDDFENYGEQIVIDGVTDEVYSTGMRLKLTQTQNYDITDIQNRPYLLDDEHITISGTILFEYSDFYDNIIMAREYSHSCYIEVPEQILGGPPQTQRVHTGTYSSLTCSTTGIFGFQNWSTSRWPWDEWSFTLKVGSMGVYSLVGGTWWDRVVDFSLLTDAEMTMVGFLDTDPIAPGGYGLISLDIDDDIDPIPHTTTMNVGVGAMVMEYQNVPNIDVTESVSFGDCYKNMDLTKSRNLSEVVADVVLASAQKLIDAESALDTSGMRTDPHIVVYKRKNL